MYRKVFSLIVMSITILTANLLTTSLSNYLVTYKNHVRPLIFTIIGMTVTVLIFYPLFTKLEEWVKDLSTKIVKTGKSLAGKYLGLALTLIICLMVLIYFYGKMWYHIDFLRILVTGNIGRYI
jgi:sterol desaturase/sphingolipid hydroxylase (fatty acid hydroxylase superfamily)